MYIAFQSKPIAENLTDQDPLAATVRGGIQSWNAGLPTYVLEYKMGWKSTPGPPFLTSTLLSIQESHRQFAFPFPMLLKTASYSP